MSMSQGASKGVFSRALGIFVFFTILCGVVFTLVITGIAQVVFPYQANGQIITVDGKTYGSNLIGQQFNDAKHMWGRVQNLSVTEDPATGDLAVYSGPSNKTPAGDYKPDADGNEGFKQTVADRVKMIKEANPDADMDKVSQDLVTNSGSGLDPDISRDAAEYQVPRLVKETGKSKEEIEDIINKCSNGKFLGVFGEDTVNVLKVNLMLDGILK